MKRRPKGLGVALAVGATLAQARDARAQPNEPDWAFGEPAAEPVVAAVCLASFLSVFIPQRRTQWGPLSPRDREEISDIVSDFTGAGAGGFIQVLTGYFLDSAYYQTAGASYPFARALKTSMIDLEALALSTGLTAAIKRTAGRCRPRSWVDDACEDDDEAYASFPSGHTSAVSGVAGARVVLAVRSSGPAEFRVAGLVIAESAAVATAILRVTAGAHSWEDVTAGWILGHVTGSLVAIAHPMDDISIPNQLPEAEASPQTAPMMLGWSGVF